MKSGPPSSPRAFSAEKGRNMDSRWNVAPPKEEFIEWCPSMILFIQNGAGFILEAWIIP